MYCNMFQMQTSFISSTLSNSAEVSRPRGLYHVSSRTLRGDFIWNLEVSVKFEPGKVMRIRPL